VIGGVVSATLLTLVVLPVLYAWAEGGPIGARGEASGYGSELMDPELGFDTMK